MKAADKRRHSPWQQLECKRITNAVASGAYGGRYVPETLMAALEELELAYEKAKKDKKFQARLADLLRNFAGASDAAVFRATAHRETGWREDLSEA